MKKLLGLLAIAALSATPLGATAAASASNAGNTCTAVADGPWTDPDTWFGCGFDQIPSNTTDVAISGHHVTLTTAPDLADSGYYAADVNVTDDGTLTIADATDEYGDPVSTTLFAEAVNLTNGGTLNGVGHINAIVTNSSGVVEPMSTYTETLMIHYIYTQEAAGTLKLRVGTDRADTLNFAAHITLGGTLDLTYDSGFEPASDINLPVLTMIDGSHYEGGDFSTVVTHGTGPTSSAITRTPPPTTCTDQCTLMALSFPGAPHSVEPTFSGPTIKGNPWPGQTLTCAFTGNGYPGYYEILEWFRDGVSLNNPTKTYAVQPGDLGHQIQCEAQVGTTYSVGGLSQTVTVVAPPSATTLPPTVSTPPKSAAAIKVAPKQTITAPQVLVTAAENGYFCYLCLSIGGAKIMQLGPKIVPLLPQQMPATPGQAQTFKPMLTKAAKKAIAKSPKKRFTLILPLTFVPADGGAPTTTNVTLTIRKKNAR